MNRRQFLTFAGAAALAPEIPAVSTSLPPPAWGPATIAVGGGSPEIFPGQYFQLFDGQRLCEMIRVVSVSYPTMTIELLR